MAVGGTGPRGEAVTSESGRVRLVPAWPAAPSTRRPVNASGEPHHDGLRGVRREDARYSSGWAVNQASAYVSWSQFPKITTWPSVVTAIETDELESTET